MSMFKSSSIRTKLPSSTSSMFKSVMLLGNSSGFAVAFQTFQGEVGILYSWDNYWTGHLKPNYNFQGAFMRY